MAGRRPKPTKLKIIAGNPGKRPLNLNEPAFGPADLTPPAHLDEIARLEWESVVKHLHVNGLFTEPDRAPLALYCQAISKARSAQKAGDFREFAKLAKAFAVEFGFTPAARSRLHVKPAEKPKDDEQRYFG